MCSAEVSNNFVAPSFLETTVKHYDYVSSHLAFPSTRGDGLAPIRNPAHPSIALKVAPYEKL
jgi:hypothetical protein